MTTREEIDRILFALEAGEITVFKAKQKLSEAGVAIVYDIQAPAFGKQWAKFEPLIKE